jgi:trigger factor
LSTTDTLETNEPSGTPEEAHGHEGHDHDHNHEHQHGPVLNPEVTREVDIDVPAEDVAKAFRTVTRNYQRYAKLPGFRPGKVPESVVKRKFAAEIRKDVIEGLLPERFGKSVKELGLSVVGQPQITELTIEDGQPMHVKAVFEYMPEVPIEGYEQVVVEEDRPLADGDWAQISYSGTVTDDPEAAPVAGEDSLVEVGGKDTVDAFTQVLRGAKAGQELKAEVIYPADYPEPKLQGKTVSYDLSVKAIKKRILPELNEDFAKEMGNYESLEQLENAVREHLANRKRRSVESETKDRLFAALVEKFQFPVPESMVQQQVDARLERGLRALAAQGMNPEQMRKLDFGRLRVAQRDSAVAEVKAQILLDRIAEKEGVTVSDEELDRELHLVALQSREPYETLHQRLTDDGGLARIREQLKREKTASLLYERLPA